MSPGRHWRRDRTPSWCPGCGNYGVLDALVGALDRLQVEPWRVCIVAGIGQSGKVAHQVRSNFFHGLHGRALAHALGVKLANPDLTVIAVGGDGDIYGEGAGHLVHALRRNLDIACLVHNNGVYGLTKGQPSPTAPSGSRSRFRPEGVTSPPLDPLKLAIAAGGSFIARGYAGMKEHLAGLIVDAVRHRGFGLLDILQPCVTYDRIRTYEWYAGRIYDLASAAHDAADRRAALARADEWPSREGSRIPVGVFYRAARQCHEDGVVALKNGPLVGRSLDPEPVRRALEELR